jgi:hypothetical protein
VWALPLTTLSALCASEHAEHRQRSHPRSDANHNLVIITTSIKHQTYSLHQTSLLLPRGAVALQPPLLEQMERVSTRHAPHPTRSVAGSGEASGLILLAQGSEGKQAKDTEDYSSTGAAGGAN